ncbi:hypothetical protein CAEBREN_03373 [Caenorhabditis brenneri]|uniref:Uncharacterized protein n=1 Tax=Caenorhabditis brenneri TaxID=135651 RepID=G0P356_CAEBE|nr:hypothetical protein CAEBREN_03373 [Caenorhabditis brenneri]
MDAMDVIDEFWAMREAMVRTKEEQEEMIRQKEAMMVDLKRIHEEKEMEKKARDGQIEMQKEEYEKQQDVIETLDEELKELKKIAAALIASGGSNDPKGKSVKEGSKCQQCRQLKNLKFLSPKRRWARMNRILVNSSLTTYLKSCVVFVNKESCEKPRNCCDFICVH